MVDGDSRAAFVQLHLGHRFHHLYLWFLLDHHSIMSLVLTKLSADVAMDTENVHTDTQQVQRRRKKNAQDEEERAERKKFRAMVGEAMARMSRSAKLDTLVNRIDTSMVGCATLETKISKDETTVLELRVKILEAEKADNTKLAEIYSEHLDHHRNRMSDTQDELDKLKASQS